MAEISQNIFFQWLSWHFFEVPKEILKAWKNFLKFDFNYFSIPLLAKTLFSHWRKYRWFYPRGFDFGKYIEVAFSNLISRLLGAILRIFLVFFGILVEVFIFFIGFFIFFSWLILPLLLIFGLILGVIILF